jgi:hypothetical protein
MILTRAKKFNYFIFFQYFLTFNITSIIFYYSSNKKNYYKTIFFFYIKHSYFFEKTSLTLPELSRFLQTSPNIQKLSLWCIEIYFFLTLPLLLRFSIRIFAHAAHVRKIKQKTNFTHHSKTTPFWASKLQYPPNPKQRHLGHYYYYYFKKKKKKKSGVANHPHSGVVLRPPKGKKKKKKVLVFWGWPKVPQRA